jgi:hypothetical protein
MPRIAGVDIPNNKRTDIALRYIFGVGPTRATEICQKAEIDPVVRAGKLTEEEVSKLAGIIESDYVVEGQLRRQIAAEHLAAARDPLLPRPAAHPRASRAGAAHADQCPHAQGPPQDRRRQEGYQGNALSARKERVFWPRQDPSVA